MLEDNFPFVSLTSTDIDENSSNNTEVGSIYTLDNSGGVYTYTLLDDAGGRFKLIDNKIVVADGSKLDYEASDMHDITLRVTNSAGETKDLSFMIDVLNVVEAGEKPPVMVSLTDGFVEENASTGTVAGVFESFNPTETSTYALIDDAGGRFTLAGNKLIVADGEKLDFETADYHSVIVRVTDRLGNVTDMEWGVEILDVQDEENYIYGTNKADKLYGSSGHDTISGLGGKDYLVGDSGKDVFRFEHVKLGKSNVDRIADFSVKDDTIELHTNTFTNLETGDLDRQAFWTGAKAHDASDRIIYDAKKGYLYYDADGSGAAKQVLFATLSKNLKMTASDFDVIF